MEIGTDKKAIVESYAKLCGQKVWIIYLLPKKFFGFDLLIVPLDGFVRNPKFG